MPFPEPPPWDRKEVRRPVMKESLGNSPVVSRWRDSNSFSYRGDHHHGASREYSRRGSAEYRRPPGRGRQHGDWHMYPEDSGFGYMPSKTCERVVDDRNYWSSSSRFDGKYRSGRDYSKVRGYQKDWDGHAWQQNNLSNSSAERPVNYSPVFYGGKQGNEYSEVPFERRRNGQFRSFGSERPMNGFPGDRQSNGFSGGSVERSRNGFTPNFASERSISSFCGDKQYIGFSGHPTEKSHNGYYSASNERLRYGFSPSVASERPIRWSPTGSRDHSSPEFTCISIDKIPNGYSPRIAAESASNVSPPVSGDKQFLVYPDSLIEKTRNGYSVTSFENVRNGFPHSAAAGRSSRLSPTVSGDEASHGPSGTHKIPHEPSPSVASEMSMSISPTVSEDKPCLGYSGAPAENICNGYSVTSVEKTHNNHSPNIAAERPSNLTLSISAAQSSLGDLGAPADKISNGFSSGIEVARSTNVPPANVQDKPFHGVPVTSTLNTVNGHSPSIAPETPTKTPPITSGDMPCSGLLSAQTGIFLNGISVTAAVKPPQKNNDNKLLGDIHAYDGKQTSSICLNEPHEDSIKVGNESGICEADELSSVPKNENGNFMGYDWKPHIWSRSGSLSSRGRSSSSGRIATDSREVIDGLQHIDTTVCSPSSDGLDCVTTSPTSEETASRKKARLGWGQGLAKYEKKVVDVPNDCGDKSQISSPRTGRTLECTSPATPSSAACSSSPGVEHRTFEKTGVVDPIPVYGSGSFILGCLDSVHSDLEKLDMSLIEKEVQCLLNLIHSDSQCPSSSFSLRSDALCKLLLWRTEILKAVETTDSELETLENEVQYLKSESRSNDQCSSTFSSLNSRNFTKSNEKEALVSGNVVPVSLEGDSLMVKYDFDSPGTSTSKRVTPSLVVKASAECVASQQIMDLNIVQCSEGNYSDHPNHVKMNMENDSKLYKSICAANKDEAGKALKELPKLLSPDFSAVINHGELQSDLSVKEKFAQRKKVLRFTERAVTLKYRALQQLWKEDSRLLEVRRNHPKSSKKSEPGSSSSQYVHLRSSSSVLSRFSSHDGSKRLVPSSETINLTSKLHSDCQVKVYRDTLKMPSLILDEKEKQVSRFVSFNGLVDDPVVAEKERTGINPWTSEEIETFLDKLNLFGKDFRKISSYLDHKTTADCVEFYYKKHKSSLFEKTRKKPVKFGSQSKRIAKPAYLVTSGGKLSQETAAADVLAGLCGSLTSDAVSSCVTSSFDHGGVQRSWKHTKMGRKRKRVSTQEIVQNINEETCSDESCSEIDFSTLDWTDEEKYMLLQAVKLYGNDFEMVSKHVKTRFRDQCKAFYSKAKKRLCLIQIHDGHGNVRLSTTDKATGIGVDGMQEIDVRLAVT